MAIFLRQANNSLKKAWRILEETAAAHPPPVFWWRDDDISWNNPLHLMRNISARQNLQWMLHTLAKYGMPHFCAVVPFSFLRNAGQSIRMLEQSECFVAIHGLRHRMRGRHCEFPPGLDGERERDLILNEFDAFGKRFGEKLLPVFVPPYNAVTMRLAGLLNDAGILVSAGNVPGLAASMLGVDYDLVNWQKRRLLDHAQILLDMAGLLKTGRLSIGINGRHKIIRSGDKIFIERLVEFLSSLNASRKAWFQSLYF